VGFSFVTNLILLINNNQNICFGEFFRCIEILYLKSDCTTKKINLEEMRLETQENWKCVRVKMRARSSSPNCFSTRGCCCCCCCYCCCSCCSSTRTDFHAKVKIWIPWGLCQSCHIFWCNFYNCFK